MHILEKIRNSIYNPSFYQELLNKPFGYSVKYFYALTMFVALVVTIIASIIVVPFITSTAHVITTEVAKTFPADLHVTIKDGVASSTVAEPYTLEVATSTATSSEVSIIISTSTLPGLPNSPATTTATTSPKYLLVIDTKDPTSQLPLDVLARFDTSALLTHDSFVSYKNDQVVTSNLKSVPDITIDRDFITSFSTKVAPLLKYLLPLGVLGMYIFFFLFMGIGLPIYLLAGALLIWAVAYLRGYQITYGKAYQIGLHALTLPVLLIFMHNLILFTLILLIIIFLNLKPRSNVSAISSDQSSAGM